MKWHFMEGASVTPAKRKGGKSEPRTPRCNSGKKRHFINFCFGRNKGDDESDEEDEAPCSSGEGSTAAVGDAGGHSGLTPAMGAMDVEQCTPFVAWAAGGALGAVAVQCCLVCSCAVPQRSDIHLTSYPSPLATRAQRTHPPVHPRTTCRNVDHIPLGPCSCPALHCLLQLGSAIAAPVVPR